MPPFHTITEYPRMLFKGDETLVVTSADAKAAALGDGWQVRLLPGETLDEYAFGSVDGAPKDKPKPGKSKE